MPQAQPLSRWFDVSYSYKSLRSSFLKGSFWQRAIESSSVCRMRRMSTRQSPDIGIRRVLPRQVRRDNNMLLRIFRINYCGHFKSNPPSCCLSRSLTNPKPILVAMSRRPVRIFTISFYCFVVLSSGGEHYVPVFSGTSYETVGVICSGRNSDRFWRLNSMPFISY